MFNIEIDDFFNKHIHSKRSVVIVLFVLFCTIQNLSLPFQGMVKFLSNIVFCFSLFCLWAVVFRIPKHKSKRIGITIAIYCENQDDSEKIKNDLIAILKERLEFNRFSLIVLRENLAKKIDWKNAKKYLDKTNSNLLIYGHHKIRQIKGKPHNVIIPQGVIGHNFVHIKVSEQISKDFREFLPKKFLIPKNNDLFGFDLTVDILERATLYMIGLSALVSGEIKLAINYFEKIYSKSSNLIKDDYLNRKIKERIIDSYITEMQLKYDVWRNCKDRMSLEAIKGIADKIELFEPDNYEAKLNKAIYYFVYEENTNKALEQIEQCKTFYKDDNWRFSYAFLNAVKGNLDIAYDEYKKMFQRNISSRTVIDVEEFIGWVIEEKKLYQLYYCLGLINYYIKKDYESAKQDLKYFIEFAADKYSQHKDYAKNYISKINALVAD
ncbi:hypothetical protein ACFLZV_01100 [Candidatus Margulisiibacteriota bacterium]